MGSAVSISPVHTIESTHFYELLNNHEELLKLYNQISSYGHQEGQINIKNKISLTEMLLFIEKNENIILKEALSNTSTEVIKTAFEFATGKKGTNHEMNKKEFYKFLPIVYLFDHLWKVFDMADSSIDDRRIFPNEFLTAKFTIESIQGVKLEAITREEWEKEFHVLDKNKDGYITFNEFCKYAVSKIVTPQHYIDALKRLEMEEFASLVDPTEALNPLNPLNQPHQVISTVTISSDGTVIEKQLPCDSELVPIMNDNPSSKVVVISSTSSQKSSNNLTLENTNNNTNTITTTTEELTTKS